MNTIGKNEDLFTYMSIKKLYILDSILLRMEICDYENGPFAELDFELTHGNCLFKLKCSNIVAYSFYFRIHKPVYTEKCKFFKKDELFYLCLDPYDELAEINENDQDFILCKEIEGFVS